MQKKTANTDSTIEVTIAAIDGENLVLETASGKNRIYWPLENIPQPLDIGNKLTLELRQDECAAESAAGSSTSLSTSDAALPRFSVNLNREDQDDSNDANTKMRRHLEDLVN